MTAILSVLLEVWKPIEGFPSYLISNKGRVMSVNHRVKSRHKTRVQKGSILNPSISGEGYCSVTLWRNNRPTRFRVHRLVAKAFLPNPNNFPQVNHRNYNRSDNRVENLEWCTAEYNLAYSKVLEKSNESCRKKVKQELNGRLIRIWNSISDASRSIKGDDTLTGNIAYCCKGKRHSCMGFNWSYC